MNSIDSRIAEIKASEAHLRDHAAYYRLPEFSLVELSGPDAESFLQGRSSNDVKALEPGQGQLSSFLDRKGYLIAFASIHRLEAELANEKKEYCYWLFNERRQSQVILNEFATYHFRERIKYQELDSQYAALALQGPASEKLLLDLGLQAPLEFEYDICKMQIFSKDCFLIKRSFCGDNGYLILLAGNKQAEFMSLFTEFAEKNRVEKISDLVFDTVRVEAGQALFGVDIGSEHMLPETGLEQAAASYNKGCFQGQEVLARIKTYGAPKRALVGLVFDELPDSNFELDSKFFVSEGESLKPELAAATQEAGCIKSNLYSPALDKHIALAYVNRDFRVPDKRLEIAFENGKSYFITVKFLPFYSAGTNKEKAALLYKTALQEFATNSEEKAIELLRKAIDLDPLLADAYESLGVILSRHEQYDEAIALMHRLQSLMPDSVMAHTNLSVYYMHLGDKERAEEEKAIAMSIRMSQLAAEHLNKKKQEEEKAKQEEEGERRLAMFRQVLEIDPQDFLANNGVGTVYVELGKYEEALPYLKKAIEVKPTHTVAYLALAQAYEKLFLVDEAINICTSGIEIAAKRGDLSPMKEMQAMLFNLESKKKELSTQ